MMDPLNETSTTVEETVADGKSGDNNRMCITYDESVDSLSCASQSPKLTNFEINLVEKMGSMAPSGPFEIFVPSSSDLIGFSHENYMRNVVESKIRPRLIRFGSLFGIPLMIFIILVFSDDASTIDLNKLFGFGLMLIFVGYFCHLFSIFTGFRCCCKCNNNIDFHENRTLYRIYSANAVEPYWVESTFTYRALLFYTSPIQSISEFSAVQGGIAQSMLLFIAYYSFVTIICALVSEMHWNDFKFSIAEWCELTGCMGLVLIATFELDPFIKRMKQIHYLGAALGSLTCVGFIYQQIIIGLYKKDGNPAGICLSLFLAILAVSTFVIWQYYGAVAKNFSKIHDSVSVEKWRDDVDLRKQITKISYQNLISEAIFLFCGAMSMCLWLVFLRDCHKNNQCWWTKIYQSMSE